MLRCAMLGSALLAIAAAPAHATAYLDPGSFYNAIAAAAPVVLSPSPLYTAVSQDAFGSYDLNSGTVSSLHGSAPAAGRISGSFGCFGSTSQCFGAYQVTLTFPYAISGFAGQLNYFDQAATLGQPILNLPSSVFNAPYVNGQSPYNYLGFYGETFAPTTTLSFVWGPGVPPLSRDAFAFFDLQQAVALVPVPEPSSMATLVLPAAAGILRRRRQPLPSPSRWSRPGRR